MRENLQNLLDFRRKNRHRIVPPRSGMSIRYLLLTIVKPPSSNRISTSDINAHILVIDDASIKSFICLCENASPPENLASNYEAMPICALKHLSPT